MTFFFEDDKAPEERPGVMSYQKTPPLNAVDALLHVGTFERLLSLGPAGDYWVELKTNIDALTASRFSDTAIGSFFETEFKQEGGHPRRWFALISNQGGAVRMPVVLCVTPPGEELKNPSLVNDVHTTGYQNRNPYPEFEWHIEQLSAKIGIDLPPNYMGQPLEVSRVPGR
jgi:hypothetical protein